LLDDPHRQMSLAHADAADEQQAGVVVSRVILFHEFASRHSGFEQVRMRPVEFEVREFAVLIPLGNSRRSQQALRSLLQTAVATDHPISFGRLPPTSTTLRTNFNSNLHEQVSLLNVHCASAFPQVPNEEALWQSCGAEGCFVEKRGKIVFTTGTQRHRENRDCQARASTFCCSSSQVPK